MRFILNRKSEIYYLLIYIPWEEEGGYDENLK